MADSNSDNQLPPGWTVEVKVRKNGRRDKSAGVAKKPKLSVGRVTRRSIMGQGTNLDRIVNDQQTPQTACTGESLLLSEQNSWTMGIELTDLVPSQVECSDEKGEKLGLAENNLIPSCVDGIVPEKQLPESSHTKHETEKVQKGQGKSKRKKEINLPRRASKRLAGIQVDPVPELILRRRNAAKNSSEAALTNEDKSSVSSPNEEAKKLIAHEGGPETKRKPQSLMNTMESLKLNQSKHSLCAPEKLPEKTMKEPKSEKDQGCYSFSPLGNTVMVKEQEKDPEGVAKFDYSLDLPLGELLSDPCIAFAIQTLTEGTFEASQNTQISSELSNSKYSETSVSAKGDDRKIKGHNVSDWKQGCNVSSPKEPVAEQAGSTSKSPFGISWMDPCIEFAVKTLTGNIPMEYDPNSENCLQQHLGASNNQGLSEVAATSGGSLNNLCQTDYYCSQYLGTQNPVFRQQPYLDPALPNVRSVGMGNSAGARLHQFGGEDRRNGCQR